MTRSPGDPLTVPARALVARAEQIVEAIAPSAALLSDDDILLVDLRDVRELAREGVIPGAHHAPRGMLEFWVDPESPYYKPALDDGRALVLYCGSGWRSALAGAALVEMGRPDVRHLDGGFAAWKAAGLPVEKQEKEK